MASKAKTNTIKARVIREAESREIPKKKLEEFLAKKEDIDTRLNDRLDDLLAEFRKDISVFICGHLKLDPKHVEEVLGECSVKMKTIMADTTILFAGIGDSAYKMVIYETLVKGLTIVKDISVEMNNLKDSIDEVKKH